MGRKHSSDEVGGVAVLGTVAAADADNPEICVLVEGDGDLCASEVSTGWKRRSQLEQHTTTEEDQLGNGWLEWLAHKRGERRDDCRHGEIFEREL